MDSLRECLAEYYQKFQQIKGGPKTANLRATAEATYITVGLFVILPTLRSRAIRLLQVAFSFLAADVRRYADQRRGGPSESSAAKKARDPR
jgi:hypothetical protein